MENPDFWWVDEAPDLEWVGDRRRTYPEEEALDLPSNQPIVLVAVRSEDEWVVDKNWNFQLLFVRLWFWDFFFFCPSVWQFKDGKSQDAGQPLAAAAMRNVKGLGRGMHQLHRFMQEISS